MESINTLNTDRTNTKHWKKNAIESSKAKNEGQKVATDQSNITSNSSPSTTITVSKQKCQIFFTNLIKLAANEGPAMYVLIRELIQKLIDAKLTAEDFYSKVENLFNVHHKTFLPGILEKGLPSLRLSMLTNEIEIKGINPPPASVGLCGTKLVLQDTHQQATFLKPPSRTQEKSNNTEENMSQFRATLNHLYNVDEESKVAFALNEIGYIQAVSLFKEAKIDFEVYVDMDEKTIWSIFNNFPPGIVKKFELRYRDWQSKNVKERSPAVTHTSSDQHQDQSLHEVKLSKKRKFDTLENDNGMDGCLVVNQSNQQNEKRNEKSHLKPFHDFWKDSSKLRLMGIKKLNGQDKITKILNTHGFYKRPDGADFVSIDFNSMYPDITVNFVEDFEANASKMLEVIRKADKTAAFNGEMGNILTEYTEASKNSKAAIIITGLHSLHYVGYWAGLSKQSSIKNNLPVCETVKFMICLNKSDSIDTVINQRRHEVTALGYSLQPFIVVHGEKYSDISDDIVLVVGYVKYSFKSLVEALESLLKIYVVFDLQWPEVNPTVYSFLTRLFLNIDKIV